MKDPEGLFKQSSGAGTLLKQNSAKRLAETDKEFEEQQKAEAEKVYKAMVERRAGRTPPQDDVPALVEYMLDTEFEDMAFEITRCRPLLNDGYFAELKAQISALKLGDRPNETRLGELEVLLKVTEGGVADVDRNTQAIAAPADRLRALLTAPDKKAKLLEMVGNNEIDSAFMELLSQNIIGANAAGEEQAAQFMFKLLEACKKYSLAAEPTRSAAEAAKEKAPEPEPEPAPSPLILDGKAEAPKPSGAPSKLIL